MASLCIYNNQEECDPRECDNENCSRSSFSKLKCTICGELIEDVYYEIRNDILCKKCVDELYKKHID